MSNLIVGRVVPVGGVIERPTGELALLWQMYANLLERQRELEANMRKERRKQRK